MLASEHPAHVAAAWLGHSTLVANKHYWHVTDADFAKAIGSVEAAQNPAQQAHATIRTDSHDPPPAHKKTRELPVLASRREKLHTREGGR